MTKYHSTLFILACALSLFFFGCERDIDDLQPAPFPTTAEIFIDGFSAGLQYNAFGDSKVTAFGVDNEIYFDGIQSMRFEVPNNTDPAGGYAGGIFSDASGRDLSSYNALTFWARSSVGETINEIGLGLTFASDTYRAVANKLEIGSSWQKYYIPLPDPEKLKIESGLLWYAEAADEGGSYTFWLDEVKYENVGTINNPRPSIMGGNDVTENTFVGLNFTIDQFSATYNLPEGIDQTISVSRNYFEFQTSNPNVAVVDSIGNVSVVGPGTAIITATLANTLAIGSLTLNSRGEFEPAPVPTLAAEDVISLFSDHYENQPVDFYNGFYAPFQTTTSADFTIDGDNVLNYLNFNFVGIEFNQNVPSIDGSQMTHLHMDVFIPSALPDNPQMRVDLVDFGSNGSFGGGDDLTFSQTYDASTFTEGSWIQIDMDIRDMNPRNVLSQIVLATPQGISPISNFYLDNLYFYRDPTLINIGPELAAPEPTIPASNVISLFSDRYSDINVDTYRTDWSNASFEEVSIMENPTLKYSALDFVGIETVSSQVNASNMTHLHLDFWSPNATSFSIKLVDFGGDGTFGGGDDSEFQIDFAAPTQNEWVAFDIPLSDFVGLTSRANIAQYILVAQPTGGATVFIDNFFFYNDNVNTEPTEAAPTPTLEASKVISLFSSAYDDVAIDTYRTDWSNATLEEVIIQGRSTLKYSDMDFVGIETVSSMINANDMTHFHIDIWSPDITVFGVKLVDFGADGAFGGGDDVEHQLNFEGIRQGEWVSYDIPLVDFEGLTTRGNLSQYILVGQPSGATTVFVDNIYFHN